MTKNAELRLGIDFGTSTTAISLKVGDEQAFPLPIGLDGTTPYIPSVVYFPPVINDLAKDVVVGELAEQSKSPGQIISSIKRCLGCRGERCEKNRANGGHWCHGDGKAHIPGIGSLAPENVAYFVIREALRRAVKVAWSRFGIDLRTLETLKLPRNIGCGAAFDYDQRKMLRKILAELGFKDVSLDQIVEEPILAGFAFTRYATQPEGRVLIYDFGGGTFDTAILEIDRIEEGQRITVIASAGENWLGGDDIDGLVMNHFLMEIAQERGESVPEIMSAFSSLDRSQLRQLSKEAKENLSFNTSYEDVLLSNQLGLLSLRMTQAELEHLIVMPVSGGKNILDQSLETVIRACKLAYAYDVAKESDLLDIRKIIRHTLTDASEKIDRVVLVGGVTKTPLIYRRMVEIFGEEKILKPTVIDPINAVSIGAGYERERQHYSIGFPPFHVMLELRENENSDIDWIDVFLPFENYRFHESWATNSIPAHKSEIIELPKHYAEGTLVIYQVGENRHPYPIGSMRPGKLHFFVELDGIISYQYLDDRPRKLGPYPLVHPIQKEIVRNNRERYEKMMKEQMDKTAKRWITVYTEN